MIAQQTPQSAFAKALAAKAAAIQAKYDAKAPKKVEPVQEEVRVTVDLVANKNRIDVFFSAKPSESVLSELREKGFHFRPSDKAWYHQDNIKNRSWLVERFNAPLDINLSELMEDILDEPGEIEEQEAEELVDGKSEYHRIIDALCAHYNESPADVCVRAVKLLYSETL